MDDLEANARRWGIEPGYHDVFGGWHAVPETTLRAIVETLSAGGGKPATFHPADVKRRAFQGDGARIWGLGVQLYAVRSGRNWGIGDFADLLRIVDIAADAGASAVGLNPLHALFLDRPDMASPYGPNSRMFLNPLYIALDAVPEFQPDAHFEREARHCRETELVDYERVAALKTAALRAAYERFVVGAGVDRRAQFAAFRRERGDSLHRFACFEVLSRRYAGLSWRNWPAPWSAADAGALAQLRESDSDAIEFVEYVQWIADAQLAQCSAHATKKGMSVGLYLDLAIGVDPAGADAWSNQHAVLSGVSVGAPPDEFNRAGQNWGLAPFNPHVLPVDDFALMRNLLKSSMRYAGAQRLDHILGLMRLYFIPQGAGAGAGAYVRFPFEQLLAVIADESNAHNCLFIGEDLGTVPDGFRDAAARWGAWTCRVMIFERWADGEFRPPWDYPVEALATFTTHDLPTFRGWMTGADLAAKRAIAIDPGESDEARRHAQAALRRAVANFAGPNATDNFAAAAGFLAATPSRLVMVGIEDMLDVAEQVNIPGTVKEHPNWRRKLPVLLEHWASHPTFAAACAAFAYSGRSVRRD